MRRGLAAALLACALAACGSPTPAGVQLTPSPVESVPDHLDFLNTAPASPTPSAPSPPPTPEAAPTVEPPPDEPADVKPGAFCSPEGDTGTYRGRTYTCKGPGRNRWRR